MRIVKSIIAGDNVRYESILSELAHDTIVIANDQDAIIQAITANAKFHIAITNEKFARVIAPATEIMLLDSLNFNSNEWRSLVDDFPNTRIMMCKPNQFRYNIGRMVALTNASTEVSIKCITVDETYNTVGDHIPEILSIMCRIEPGYANSTRILDSYNLSIMVDGRKLKAQNIFMKSGNSSKYRITFYMAELTESIELGTCPESAYTTMIVDAMENLHNAIFWTKQLEYDTWIHQQLQYL